LPKEMLQNVDIEGYGLVLLAFIKEKAGF